MHQYAVGQGLPTVILIIIQGQFEIFQRFSSGKLVLATIDSCFVAPNYYGNGSNTEAYWYIYILLVSAEKLTCTPKAMISYFEYVCMYV